MRGARKITNGVYGLFIFFHKCRRAALPLTEALAEIWQFDLSLLVQQNGEASLFEVNIRYVGGLLSAYYLTGEEVRLIDVC